MAILNSANAVVLCLLPMTLDRNFVMLPALGICTICEKKGTQKTKIKSLPSALALSSAGGFSVSRKTFIHALYFRHISIFPACSINNTLTPLKWILGGSGVFWIRFYKSCGCPGLSLPACPLVGMTPPPGSLLRKQGKPGQVYYSQQIGKIQIPYFAPPAASRISTKNTMPAAWCISAP